MARIDIRSNGGGGSVATGVLQLQGGVAMSSTLTAVTDQNNTTSPLKLSTTAVQVVSPFRITTDDPSDMYLDCEDGSANNRFNITRNTASQQVNLNFASNPAGSTTVVGGIRTYVDGVNLTEVMKFREDGQLQIGSTSASAMYWDNVNNRLGVGTNAPNNTTEIQIPSTYGAIGSNANLYLTSALTSAGIKIGASGSGAGCTIQATQSGGGTAFNLALNPFGGSVNVGNSNLGASLGIKGGGSTSATTSLLVQNSGGSTLLSLRDDKVADFNSATILGVGTLFTQVVATGYINSSGNAYTVMRTNNSTGDATFDQFVAIGTTSAPNASAALDVVSTTKGFLPPRMTTAQKNAITTPAAGLMVYDTNLNKLCVYTTAWETITSL